MDFKELEKKLKGIKIKEHLINDSNDKIFQMDCPTDRKSVRIWIGAADVKLVDYDKKLKQAVITVKEKELEFINSVRNTKCYSYDYLRRSGWNISSEWYNVNNKKSKESAPETYDVVVETFAGTRHLLFGQDEKHYFISVLPSPAKSVKHAHEILMPPEVKKLKLSVRKNVKRQGEFFFVPVSNDEMMKYFVDDLKDSYDVMNNHCPLDKAFKENVGDVVHEAEVVHERPDYEYYVYGKVKHRRHKTLELTQWHRVYMNTEIQDDESIGFVD